MRGVWRDMRFRIIRCEVVGAVPHFWGHVMHSGCNSVWAVLSLSRLQRISLSKNRSLLSAGTGRIFDHFKLLRWRYDDCEVKVPGNSCQVPNDWLGAVL